MAILNAMKLRIDSNQYIIEIQQIFKRSPLVYSNSHNIIVGLNEFKSRVAQFIEDRKTYEAACLCKALIQKCIEHLEHIHDKEGLIGHFLFEVFELYDYSIKNIDLDREYFFTDVIQFYLEEDYGFSYEILKLFL